jgi:hydroxymethylpyrimidine pyrophosphatase-like HAD family hydrolase
MNYLALATDYDGTLAENGRVANKTIDALNQLKKSGRKLILVTGREIDDLLQVFPRVDLFHSVVAENGALIYSPSTRTERLLAASPPPDFIHQLKQRKVTPLSHGRVIVATVHPHDGSAAEVIQEMKLDLEIILNKEAVMILPRGINKQSGLQAALVEMEIPNSKVVGIGDAENDFALLQATGYFAAVQNALDSLKNRAHQVTKGSEGNGVIEIIEWMMSH